MTAELFFVLLGGVVLVVILLFLMLIDAAFIFKIVDNFSKLDYDSLSLIKSGA